MPNLVKEYKVFEADQYKHLMPQLRNAGLRPLNTADVIRERLESLNNKDLNLIAFWFCRYLDTVDGVACSNSKRKLAYNPKQLLNIEPMANLRYGALRVTPDEYKNLEGEEFSLKELEKAGLGRRLNKDEVVDHPFWLALTRGDKHMLREYRDAFFAEMKRRKYNNPDEGMEVYLGPDQELPSMRPLIVGSLLRSNARVRGNLGDGSARLVAVDSGVTEGGARNLVRTYTPQDVQKANEALKTLKGVARPEIVEPLEVLVRKA